MVLRCWTWQTVGAQNICWIKRAAWSALSTMNINSCVPAIFITHTSNSFICLLYQWPCGMTFQITAWRSQPMVPSQSLAHSTMLQAATLLSIFSSLVILSFDFWNIALPCFSHTSVTSLSQNSSLSSLPSPTLMDPNYFCHFPSWTCFSPLVPCFREQHQHPLWHESENLTILFNLPLHLWDFLMRSGQV